MTLLALAALAPSACRSNQNGRTAAKTTGTPLPAPLPRTSPLAAFASVCQPSAAPADGPEGRTSRSAAALAAGVRLRRQPYVQRVTATSADIVWTAIAAAPGRVALRAAGVGAAAEATVEAAVDGSAPLPGGARQWIATLEGLQPGTTYCYEAFHGGARVAAPTAFRTAPSPGAGPVRIAVLGDSGTGGGDQAAVLRQLDTVPYEALLHVGDIAYESGTLDELERNHFGVYRFLMASVPFFVASGNHEYRTADAAPFRQVFVLPDNGGPEGRERWYSFDWGDAHFVAIDTEKLGPAQASWLERDLAASAARWKIVFGHRPPHSSGSHGGHAGVRRFIAPVLERQRVPLALFGHDHHYERFHPQGGVTYVISGGGGRGTRALDGRAPGSAHAEAVLSFVHLTIDGRTLELRALDATGRVFDGAVLRAP